MDVGFTLVISLALGIIIGLLARLVNSGLKKPSAKELQSVSPLTEEQKRFITEVMRRHNEERGNIIRTNKD